MIALAAEDLADLRRWAISGAVVVAAYGGVATAIVAWHDTVEEASPAGAIVIEFAPVLAGPAPQPTELPPGPEMVMSAESVSKPVDTVEDKPEEKVEQQVEAKLEQKVEEERPAKPMDEPPPELPIVPKPEVALEPPPRQEVKQETPPPQEPAAPAPATTAPSVVPEQTAALPAAPAQSTTIKNSQGMMRWKSLISAALERNKRYPQQSQARREQGIAQVFFSLDRQGRVIESRIVRSSGATALDEEALALLQRAQPFPPPPREDFAGEHVDLTVPIRFNLK
jgi:periplasmic protein TonB